MSANTLADLYPAPGGIPAEFDIPEPIIQRHYLVGGSIREWSGPLDDILSPVHLRGADGLKPKLVGRAPSMTKEASLEALDAAVRAYDLGRGSWPTMSVGERISHIEEFTVRMKAKREEIVNFIMWEIGKTLPDARKEFDRTVDYIIDTVEAFKALDREGSRFRMEGGIIAQVRHSSLGVVLCMGPYNYPLNETFATLIPALIMGNTCVFKPPRLGVLLYEPLLEAFRDCFPAGVLNTVYGDGETCIRPIMETGKVDCIAFIGSSRVADLLKKYHPYPHRLRAVLGMGAKNAAVILPDADLDLTVKECVLGGLSYNGQRCTALKIFFVHQSILEPFLEKMSALVATLKPGMPWDEGVNITPLPVPGKSEYLNELIRDAESFGGKVVNPGGGEFSEALFSPAVVCPVAPNARLYKEEQFGPVLPIVPFDDLEHPISWIHESPFGQQVSLFGTDANVLAVLLDPLLNQVCRVNVNSQCQRGPDTFPFTGRKGSAEGTLSVADALDAFSIRTLVAAKENDINKRIITDIVRGHKSNFLSTDFIF